MSIYSWLSHVDVFSFLLFPDALSLLLLIHFQPRDVFLTLFMIGSYIFYPVKLIMLTLNNWCKLRADTIFSFSFDQTPFFVATTLKRCIYFTSLSLTCLSFENICLVGDNWLLCKYRYHETSIQSLSSNIQVQWLVQEWWWWKQQQHLLQMQVWQQKGDGNSSDSTTWCDTTWQYTISIFEDRDSQQIMQK